MLHTETVTTETLALIKRLMADEELKDFTLVGGTALALHLGHRVSIDIDLFSIKGFNTEQVAKSLSDRYQTQDTRIRASSIGWHYHYNDNMADFIKKEVTIYTLEISGTDPITDPDRTLVQVFDEKGEVIAEHNSNPGTYRWSSMITFAAYCASRGIDENAIDKETLKEWLDLGKNETNSLCDKPQSVQEVIMPIFPTAKELQDAYDNAVVHHGSDYSSGFEAGMEWVIDWIKDQNKSK